MLFYYLLTEIEYILIGEKRMRILKQNKLLSLLAGITLLVWIISIFLPAILPQESKKIISQNIERMVGEYQNNQISTFKNYRQEGLKDIEITSILWIFGISIIGLPIEIFVYNTKVLLLGMELSSYIRNWKVGGVLFGVLYFIPKIIKIGLWFLLELYASYYSISLIKNIFLKKNIDIKKATTRYTKLLFILTIILWITLTLEIWILPKLIRIFLS